MLCPMRMHLSRIIRTNVLFQRLVSATLNSCASSSSTVNDYRPVFKRPSLPEYRDTPYGSQYSPISQIEIADQTLKDYLLENNPRTFQEWNDAKSFFYTEIPLLSDVNYTSIVMNFLLHKNEIELGQSFMKYLQESNLKPNTLTYLQYMALCGKNVERCGQEVILQTYKKVRGVLDDSPVLDVKRTLYLIQGLCGTDLWQAAFDYLKKLPYKPSLEMKNCLAAAAIRNSNEFLAWEIVTQWLKNGEEINHSVIKEFLKYAIVLLSKDQRKAELYILKFFKYLDQRHIVVNEEAAGLIERFFKSHSSKWHVSYTKVSRLGDCNTCRRFLKLVEFTDEEFIVLRNSFLNKSVKKRDIFINTTEREFARYIEFIESRKPFHIVIDGLNVAYTLHENKNTKNLALHLLKIVERVAGKQRKILVLGRKHMSNWPQGIMGKISQRACIFLTSNISQDDPFVLYAALASGPHTYVLSRDLMRDHISRLEDSNLISLFKKWQQAHQVLVFVDEDKNLKFTEPVKHSITIQGNMESGWHIPFDDKVIRDPYEELNNWMCIQKVYN